MTHATLLLGHADDRSFNTALARAYADGLESAGVEVESFQLSTLAFDPVLRVGHAGEQPLEPDLLRVKGSVERARHLVFAFPTHWASAPAVVRGLVDRLFLPGWAFRYEGAALPTGLLAGRSARVIATMDAPWWWYALSYRRALHATMGGATLEFCGVRPTRFTTVHHVRALDATARAARIERLRAQGRADGARLTARLPADAAVARP
ncbi:MAG: NAD(P)H-dependent oxidoreductase [Sandaracinaceae bacterium]|nr:NAD(P)H-dependent oxidoreductase [Sandaracinaceae bacterium]